MKFKFPNISFFNNMSDDMGIDLGTANTLVHCKEKGIIIREPSVVAVEVDTNEVLAIGAEAKRMIGRTPGNIVAIRPMKDGVIADFTATQLMLKNLMGKVAKRYSVGKPRVVVGVPSGITEVEERAVEESVMQAGAKEVYLMEEPMAAAIGEGIKAAGKEADVVEVNAASLDELKKATVFALLWELKCWKKQKWSHLWKK